MSARLVADFDPGTEILAATGAWEVGAGHKFVAGFGSLPGVLAAIIRP